MFLIDMRISPASAAKHSEVIARAKEGQSAQFGSDGSQPSANWPAEVGQIPRQAPAAHQNRVDQAGSAQPSYSAHIPIWYSIFPLDQ
jgi:hypothetical protein